jgi:hypothetical protein
MLMLRLLEIRQIGGEVFQFSCAKGRSGINIAFQFDQFRALLCGRRVLCYILPDRHDQKTHLEKGICFSGRQ